jgi:hypothetical protein
MKYFFAVLANFTWLVAYLITIEAIGMKRSGGGLLLLVLFAFWYYTWVTIIKKDNK